MNPLIDAVTRIVRKNMLHIARLLNKISRGRLSPNFITWFGLIMHVPVAYLIATEHSLVAGLLLAVFGLFDALDGALARVQQKVSDKGMMLDASSDRFKEVMLYSGVAYAISLSDKPQLAAWAVAACGMSICVSYIKAKGEAAIRDSSLTPNEVNRLFTDGIFRFQVRMFVLVIGLVTNQLLPAVIIIAILSTFTAFERLIKISRRL